MLAGIGTVAQGNGSLRILLEQFDFISYYGPGKLILQGHGGQLYDLHALGHVQAALIDPHRFRGGILPFFYPPYTAMLLAPLATLPYAVAYFLWLGVNVAALAWALHLLKAYIGQDPRVRQFFVRGAVSAIATVVTLMQGQLSILLLLLFTAHLLALRHGRNREAGLLLALAIAKPTYVVPLLLVLAIRRRWDVLRWFAAGVVALTAMPATMFGPTVLIDFARLLVAAGGWTANSGFSPAVNNSMLGTTGLLFDPAEARVMAGFLDLLLLALLAWVARRHHTADIPVGVACVVALLASPHVLIHDLTILLLPIAIALRWGEAHRRRLFAGLGLSYVAAFAGLRLAPWAHLQLSLFAMLGLLGYLALCRGDLEEAESPVRLRHAPTVQGSLA